ncbi:hypothetical protein GPA19_04440 [Azoarcus indigens]|nr:hypothetical protein [Azoarcus indigens]NMG64195.1 hypothetical protein [Azoarcus indigens]
MASVLLFHIAAGLALFVSIPNFSVPDLFLISLIALSAFMAGRVEMAKAETSFVLQSDGSLKIGREGGIRTLRVQAGAVDFGFILWIGLADDEIHTARGLFRLGLVPRNMKVDEWRAFRIWLRLLAFKRSAESA